MNKRPALSPLQPLPALQRLACTRAQTEIMHRLLPLTRRHSFDFHRCPRCDKIYWPGSHHDQMREHIENTSRDLFTKIAGLKTAPRPN